MCKGRTGSFGRNENKYNIEKVTPERLQLETSIALEEFTRLLAVLTRSITRLEAETCLLISNWRASYLHALTISSEA